VAVNIGVYAGAVRDHQALMFRKVVFALCVLAMLCVAALIAGRIVIAQASKGKTYSNVSLIPHRRVGLILGCPKRTFGGWSNPYFENRIAAAAELYNHRKIDYFVVSGDNHVQSYDEPTDMKDALIDKGVPADRVYLDYAGFRTLDSVVRVKEIFGQERVTIISQKFQNQRAIFLADHHGIDAIGFNAPEVALRYSLKTMSREQFAKVKAVLDVYLLHKQPHFLGQRIPIGCRVSSRKTTMSLGDDLLLEFSKGRLNPIGTKLARLAKECVRMRSARRANETISIGTSKFGGLPDLLPVLRGQNGKLATLRS
jgi:SanA protein